ncbi:MAG TPA: DUF2917 domain-containing protein [Anaeromyxobacter sp.]|nr:DUF2917 domain-containing protein [Anaeromyxobacter sp.]
MRLELAKAETWSTQVGRPGIEVRVYSGQVWITRERDREDHVLEAPDTFESTRLGRIVICALTPARIEVAPLVLPALEPDRYAHAVLR